MSIHMDRLEICRLEFLSNCNGVISDKTLSLDVSKFKKTHSLDGLCDAAATQMYAALWIPTMKRVAFADDIGSLAYVVRLDGKPFINFCFQFDVEWWQNALAEKGRAWVSYRELMSEEWNGRLESAIKRSLETIQGYAPDCDVYFDGTTMQDNCEVCVMVPYEELKNLKAIGDALDGTVFNAVLGNL